METSEFNTLSDLGSNHINNLSDELLRFKEGEFRVPEVVPAYEIAFDNPGIVWRFFFAYGKIIERIANLSQSDIEVIKQANELGVQEGSASHYTAADFMNQISDFDKLNLIASYYSLSNPNSEFYPEALKVLGEMMALGHQMFISGKIFTDEDPETHRSIYGHTQIKDGEMLIQFTVCHLIERYISEVFKAKGLAVANTKDWFLNVITDVLALMVAKGEKIHSKVLGAWMLSRENDGLGWLKETRIERFKTILNTYV